ncbi:MAG: serine hydrolase [Clostridia bacterium]|nr:serine hydrolase [Clostridia bacterium]
MDITLQIRMIELISRFLKQDKSGFPLYGYSLQKPPFPIEKDADKSSHFKRVTPESQGLSSLAVKKLISEIEKNNRCFSVHGIMLLRHGNVIAESYWAPYKAHVPHMLYSMSKSFTSTAIGMLADEGLLSLDENLNNIFEEFAPKQSLFFPSAPMGITVRQLLTMKSGSRFNELGSVLDSDWVKMFMESSLKFEPGEKFDYNSLNSYMLAAIINRKTGMSVSEYLRTRLFEPLGIGSYEWEKCPKGIEKGGWGLSLTLEDAAKLGQLYLNGGNWNGKQLISENFIKEATRSQIKTQNEQARYGYGYHIWTDEQHSSYQFNGAFGQYVIVIPEFDAVAAIFSGNESLFSESQLLSLFHDCFALSSPLPLEEDALAYKELLDFSASLRVLDSFCTDSNALIRSYECECGTSADAFDKLANALCDKEYILTRNTASVFPQTIQVVHNNYTDGIDMISFQKDSDDLLVSFYEHTERNTLKINRDGSFSFSRPALKGERQIAGTRGVWTNDGKTLFILCSFTETPDTRIIKLSLKDGGILSTVFDELPSIDGAAAMAFKLVGLSERAFFRRLMKNLNSENGSANIRSFLMPSPSGTEITHNEEE